MDSFAILYPQKEDVVYLKNYSGLWSGFYDDSPHDTSLDTTLEALSEEGLVAYPDQAQLQGLIQVNNSTEKSTYSLDLYILSDFLFGQSTLQKFSKHSLPKQLSFLDGIYLDSLLEGKVISGSVTFSGLYRRKLEQVSLYADDVLITN